MLNSFVKHPPALLSELKVKYIPTFKDFPSICRFVTKRMMDVYDLECPGDINCGYCFIWAYFVSALTPRPLEFVTTENHVVIYNSRTKKWYDSEHTSGTFDLDEVDGFDPDTYERFSIDLQTMTFYWAHAGIAADMFRKIVVRTDPTNLLKKTGRYYDKYDSQAITVPEVIDDLQRLLTGVQNIEAQKTT